MIKIVVLCVLWLGICSGDEFDPTKFDYCPKKCASYLSSPHTACTCEVQGEREVVIDEFVHFRTSMVDLHNAYRNELARGGEETKHGFHKAANMHVINYDLELEYIANCHAKKIYDNHDKCRSKHDTAINTGQNIYGFSGKVERDRYDTFFNRSLESWYEEIQYVKDRSIVDKFRNDNSVKSNPKMTIGHFTQMTWAAVRSIGCARVFIDKNPKRQTWRSILLCNYAGRKEEGYSGNMGNFPIYKKGEPCSQCPKGEKCNKEYGGKWDALCGQSEPIPTRIPYGFEGRSPSGTNTKIPHSINTTSRTPDFTKNRDPKIPVSTNPNSRIPDFTSRSTKAPDSKVPNSKTSRAHKILVDEIFAVGIVLVILSFY